MTKRPKHVRACPKCGLIVPWTRTEPAYKDGERIGWKVKLTCPEHGDFDNISDRMNKAWSRVGKELGL